MKINFLLNRLIALTTDNCLNHLKELKKQTESEYKRIDF